MSGGGLAGVAGALPWQREAWDRVQQARRAGRLHHALLITGMPGMGKLHLANRLAQSLLCREPATDGTACGRCRGCHLFQVGNHPDYRVLAPDPESKSGEIRVDEVRALSEAAVLSAHAGGYKVVVITPADGMNDNAANSLLKTLEEPSSSTVLLLVTAHPGRLPATIRSRCQQLHLVPPPEEQTLAWLTGQGVRSDPVLALRLGHAAPLAALRYADPALLASRRSAFETFLGLVAGKEDPVAVAERWLKMDLPLLFQWLGGWVADILRLAAGTAAPHLTNPDLREPLARLARTWDTAALHRFWQRLTRDRELLESNLIPQLMVESLLIRLTELR